MKKRFYHRILILPALVLLWSALVPCTASGQEDSILISPDPTILANSEAGSQGDYFGHGVAVDGKTLAVGAPYNDDEGDNSGCAYLFSRTDVEPFPQVKLTERDDAQSNDYFGNSVDISGDNLVTGAYYKNVSNQSHSGAAYVAKFSHDESQDLWDTGEGQLITGDPGEYAEFGYAVAISGDVVVVGAHQDSEKGLYSGSVYVFRNNGSTWIREAKLYSTDAQAQEYFGSSVALDGDTIAVGAVKGGDGDTGSVYVFRYNGSDWEEEDRLFGNDLGDGDKFGYAVAVEGDTIIVGAPYHDGAASNTGAAYVFRRNGGTWIQEAELTSPDLSQNDRFGNSVALSGDTAVVGASRYDLPREEDIPLKDVGSAFLFRHNESGWNQTDKLIAPDAATQDEFGLAVAISGDTVLVGAYKRDNDEVDSGSAYVYTLAPENHPPVADAGEDQEVEEGSQVTLDGSGSFDLDYDELKYTWKQIWNVGDLEVTLDDSNKREPTFTAPPCPGENVILKFQLVVYDGTDYSEADVVEVTVLPSTESVSEITAVLGPEHHHSWGTDKDIFNFHGTEGDKVTITLKAKTGGKNNKGDRATLKLKDNIRGVSFYRVDSSRLPNHIYATLPATGQYHILVAGQPRFFRGKRFLGEYTLTLEGASGNLAKGAGPPVVQKKPGGSAKPHTQHPVWSWISNWFRH